MSDKERDLMEELASQDNVKSVEAEVEAVADAALEKAAEPGVGEEEASTQKAVQAEAEGGTEVAPRPETEVEPAAEHELAEPAPAPVQAGPTGNERAWAALAHASVLLTFALGLLSGGVAVVVGALAPLLIWLVFRDRSRFVAFHAMQATLFQLASLAAWVVLLVVGLAVLIPVWILNILLLVVLVGFLLLPLTLVLTVALPAALVVLPFASLVYGLYGGFEVYAGRPFRYWRIGDWLESRGMSTS